MRVVCVVRCVCVWLRERCAYDHRAVACDHIDGCVVVCVVLSARACEYCNDPKLKRVVKTDELCHTPNTQLPINSLPPTGVIPPLPAFLEYFSCSRSSIYGVIPRTAGLLPCSASSSVHVLDSGVCYDGAAAAAYAEEVRAKGRTMLLLGYLRRLGRRRRGSALYLDCAAMEVLCGKPLVHSCYG